MSGAALIDLQGIAGLQALEVDAERLLIGAMVPHARVAGDPRVRERILRGEAQSAADYVDLIGARKSLIARATARLAPYDAVAMPTTAITAPRIGRGCRTEKRMASPARPLSVRRRRPSSPWSMNPAFGRSQ